MSDSLKVGGGGGRGGTSNAMTRDLASSYTFSTMHEEETDRDRWPSRLAFYLAALGSAVGFGNVWRFPALAKDYGGGAFFVPYLLALFVVGLPVLMLEISLGQYYQTGNVGVFGRYHARFRGVGVAAVACGYILVTYYSMLLAWVVNAFFTSFSGNTPWHNDTATGEDGVGYFQSDIIGMRTIGDDLRPTRLVWPNVGYSALCWFIIFLCLAFGLKWTGRVAYFTMGLPIVLLFVFLGKAVSLPGSQDGIREYIGIWDWSVLSSRPEVWSVAVGQIFFSLSVSFGTMTAYGSHCPPGEPVFLNSTVIGIGNCLFSFISGFAVFATLGYSAWLQGSDVDDIPYSGFSLVFGTWPVVFGTLPGGEHWVRLIFVMLFLLGIDSAFSIMEGPITIAMDHVKLEAGGKKNKMLVTAVFCAAAFICALLYATDAGLIFLDTVDFYINFLLLLIGFFETFGAGWVFGIEEQIATYGKHAVLTWMFTNFGSVVIACGFWFGIENGETAVWAGFVALILCMLAGTGATVHLVTRQPHLFQENEDGGAANGGGGSFMYWFRFWWKFFFGNIMQLTNQLRAATGFVPTIWAIGIKQLIPHVLLILFINGARAKNGQDPPEPILGHYAGYVTWPFQVIGILCLVFCGCLILVGIAAPQIYEAMDIPARLEAQKQLGAAVEVANKQQEMEDLEDAVVANAAANAAAGEDDNPAAAEVADTTEKASDEEGHETMT